MGSEKEKFEAWFEKEYSNYGSSYKNKYDAESDGYSSDFVDGCYQAWQAAKAETILDEIKREGGYYIRDTRNQSGNSMKFWYQSGYGTKHKNFFWCATLEEAKKYRGGCGWFEIWDASYIDSLIEHTVDFQLADRSVGLIDLSNIIESQEKENEC